MKRIIQTFKLFFPFCIHKDARWYFVASLVVMGIDIFAATMLPFAFSDIIAFLKGQDKFPDAQGMLISLCGLYFCYTVLTKTMSFVQDLLFYPVINVSIRELHYKVPMHIHGLSLEEYKNLNVPEVLSFTKRIGQSARFFLRTLMVMILPTFFKFVVAFFILFQIGVYRLGLILGIVSFMIVYIFSMKIYLKTRRESWLITDRVTQTIGDSIHNTLIVRFYEAFEAKKLRHIVREEARLWFKSTMQMDGLQALLGLTLALIIGPMIYFGALSVVEGTMTVATFVLLHGQLTSFFVPLKGSVTEIRLIFESIVDVEKILMLFEKPAVPKKNDFTQEIVIDKSKPVLELENISFSYGKKKVLRNFSLQLKQGDVLHLYGKSGVGKSTLLSLITGLQEPQSGSIKLYGCEISKLSLEQISRFVHFIPQQVPIFTGTFCENLIYGIQHVSEDRIERAIRIAQLENLIQTLPQGLDTEIGEMGHKLSGGEKQRLGLARAILHQPKILIFDETTNAIDIETEKAVFKDIRGEIETIIFISHRESSSIEGARALEIKPSSNN